MDEGRADGKYQRLLMQVEHGPRLPDAGFGNDKWEVKTMQQGNSIRRRIAVFDPTAVPKRIQDSLAERLPTLDGKVVGLLHNTKDRVNELFDELQSLLKRDYPGAHFERFRKRSVSGVSPDLLEQVARCDAVITALGD